MTSATIQKAVKDICGEPTKHSVGDGFFVRRGVFWLRYINSDSVCKYVSMFSIISICIYRYI